jgi:hypothetical protein
MLHSFPRQSSDTEIHSADGTCSVGACEFPGHDLHGHLDVRHERLSRPPTSPVMDSRAHGQVSARDQSEASASGARPVFVKPVSFKSVAKLLDSWGRAFEPRFDGSACAFGHWLSLDMEGCVVRIIDQTLCASRTRICHMEFSVEIFRYNVALSTSCITLMNKPPKYCQRRARK